MNIHEIKAEIAKAELLLDELKAANTVQLTCDVSVDISASQRMAVYVNGQCIAHDTSEIQRLVNHIARMTGIVGRVEA